MLLLIGIPLRILPGSADRKTGEVIPVVQIQHSASMADDAEILIEKVKLKDPAQVNAFRQLIGKEMKIPVRVWATETASSGFWIEKGVLPTPMQSQQPRAAA